MTDPARAGWGQTRPAQWGQMGLSFSVISLKGDSYRLKDRDLGRVPAAGNTNDNDRGVNFHMPKGGQFSAAVDR